MKYIKIELPFTGFYESIPDSMINDAIECNLWDDHGNITDEQSDAIFMADVKWAPIYKEFCESYVDAFNQEFNLNCKFDEMTSPRFYNYSTDRIFCKIPADEINKIRKEVEASPGWAQYVKDHYTSYDGFWSHYSNDITDDEWRRPVLDECQYRSMLEYWLDNIQAWDERDLVLYDHMAVNEFYTIWDAVEVINKYIKKETKDLKEA